MAALRASPLFILVFVAALCASAATTEPEPPQRERAALQAFLAGTPHERALGWNSPSAPSPCLWFGVTCDAANATVVAVRLPGVGLVGGLPPRTLGDLRGLRTLSLRSNRLFGSIPADLFALPLLSSLYLQGNQLSGAIPPEVSGLFALQHLVLSHNNLSGAVPLALDGLTDLRSLRLDGNRLSGNLPSLSGLRRLDVFNVSYNQLDGSIPSSLARFPRDAFAGNLQLCGEPVDRPCDSFFPSPAPSPVEKKKKLSGAAIAAIAVGAGAGALLALVLFVLCAVYRHRAANGGDEGKAPTATAATGLTPPSSEIGDLTSSSKEISVAAAAVVAGAGAGERNRLVFVGKGAAPYSFDLEDLLRASAEVLGKGSAGTSYKAVLEGEGTTVVVKRLKDVAAARRDFASAMETLGKVEHRNLLPMRSYYFSKDEKLLVTDYLPSGSLSVMLHGSRGSGRTAMDWDARMRASLSAARGVAHLHAAYGIAHGDIRSSNLLLRPDLDAAALSDYGLQHLFAPSRPSSGTGGYRAPELVDARRPTLKSDVYSLGVLFLELLTGRSTTAAASLDRSGYAFDLPRWVQSVVREEWTAEVFDAELVRLGGGSEEEMVALLQVAMACAATAPDARPDAPDVLRMIEEIGGGHGRATTEESVQGASTEEDRSRWGTPPTGASP